MLNMPASNHPHPGTTIRDEVIKPLGLSVSDAAKKLGVSPAALTLVLQGQAPITGELAEGLELAGFSTARFWMALQTEYEAKSAGGNAFGILADKNTENITLSIEKINDLARDGWVGKKEK